MSLAQLRRGDHVMEESPLGYWHHFIVEKVRPKFALVIHKTGDGETGLRSLGESNPTGKAEVVRTRFVLEPNKVVYRIEYLVDASDSVDGQVNFSPDEVVRRARKRLGERDYNAFTSNCEHFCRDCKVGKPESYQVYDVLWTLGRLLFVALQGILGGMLFIVVRTTGFVAQTSLFLAGHAIGIFIWLIQDAVWIAYVVIKAVSVVLTSHVKMLFYSFFKSLVGKEVIVELKNDLSVHGTLDSVDQFLNIKLTDISLTDPDKYPHMLSVKNCFIRGSVVRYVQLPAEEVDTSLLQDATRKEAAQSKT